MSREHEASIKATGRDIILTIGRTMHEGLEPLLTRTLAPSLYHVYLHPQDYDRLRTVFEKIETDARQHLDRELAQLNRQAEPTLARLGKALGKKLKANEPTMRFENTDGQWYIQFQEDPDGDLGPGDVEVITELAVGEEACYGSGRKTRRIISTTRRLGKMETRREVREMQVEQTSPRQVLAWFHFTDDSGPRSYAMEQDEIVIGRRAEDVWVDLHLDTVLDVSREHARVRHRGGAFWIKDLSTFGTSVNGKPVRPSLVIEEEQERDIDHWEELPDGARVELAAVVILTFEVIRR